MNSSAPRILIVVNVFRPDLGGGVLFADLVDGLAEHGFQTVVKCAYPYYPQWKDVTGKNGIHISTDTSAGYPVERHGIFIPSNPNSFVQRLVYEASFFLSLMRKRPKRGDFDAILVFSPLIGSVAYATWVGKRTDTPVWLNVQDLSAQAASAGGILTGNTASNLLIRIQNAFFRRAAEWSSISKPMVSTLKEIPGAPSRVELLPNWLHLSLDREIAAYADVPKSTQLSPINLLYSGNIGGKQHLLAFCKQLHVSTLNFTFRIQGEGARLADLKEWLLKTNDERFELHPLSDEAGLAKALHEADFYVITEKPDAGNSFIPSKLIPGISSRTPILAVCDTAGPLGQEVQEFDLGLHVQWQDVSNIELFMRQIVENKAQLETWQQHAMKRATFYNRKSGIDRCVSMIQRMLIKEPHAH